MRASRLGVAALSLLLTLAGVAQSSEQRVAEIGSDFAISSMGGADPLGRSEATFPDVAYNSSDHTYFAVWRADDVNGTFADDEYEIFGAYVRPGLPPGPYYRISTTGPDGDFEYQAQRPVNAYNPTANEYLVVWSATIIDNLTGSKQYEIFGRRLSNTGTPLGSQIRISDLGPNYPAAGWTDYTGDWPALAYNPTGDTYLVVWVGDNSAGSLVDDEMEIWGQLVDAASGALMGSNIRISRAGTDGVASTDAYPPDVAANPDSGQYLVVWHDDRVVQYDFDIWG